MARRIFFLLLVLFVASCASAPAERSDYEGEDKGYLVYSVGTVRGFGMRFAFPYERAALPDGTEAGDWRGRIAPTVGGAIYLKIVDPDFEGFETGHVVVRAVPPGRYAITDFEFFGSGPGASYEWRSATPFALPFAVEPGRATYVGSFMRSLPPEGLLDELGPAGYFLVADRASRDLPIAEERLPAGTSMSNQYTDVDQFGSRVLSSKALEPMTP